MHHHFIDRFAMGDSPVHRLDARAKLVAVLAYTVVLISFDRYRVANLAPMAVLPFAMLWFARVPVTFALRRVAILSPFILMLVLMSPIYDRTPCAVAFGPWHFTIIGGWLTAANIAIKFALGVLALTAMMCATPFALLLEAMRVRRARDFRGAALAPVGRRLAAAGGVIGMLFIRTLDRSERVHLAMAARGYRGEPHSLNRLCFTGADAVFFVLAAVYLVACRWGYPKWF